MENNIVDMQLLQVFLLFFTGILMKKLTTKFSGTTLSAVQMLSVNRSVTVYSRVPIVLGSIVRDSVYFEVLL